MTQKWWVLSAVACGTFMATLDSSIVNIALPTLTKDLSAELSSIKWVVIIYLLVITCLLLPMGKLSDLRGRKHIFQIGFSVFICGSALCGLSPSLGWLVLCRGIQAIGASMLMANGPAVITSTFSARDRGAALGTLAMVVSAGLVTGPSIGGFLITQMGWRSIFWVNIPIGILGILLAHRFIKKDQQARHVNPFDWTGAVLQTLLLLFFIVLFDPPQVAISGSLPFPVSRWIILGLFVGLSILFMKVESEVKAPLFEFGLLRDRTFWSANLAGFLIFVAFSSVTVLMPFYLQELLHFPAQVAGFYMTAIPLTIFVVAPISGRLSDRVGSQELSVGGALIGTLGLFSMSGLFGAGIHTETSHLAIILSLCTIGLAIGLFQSPNNNAIMSSVPVNKLGMASALLATIRNLGLVTGTGLATGVYTWRITATGDFVSAIHTTFFISGAVGFFAVLAALAKRRGPQGALKTE